MNRTGFKKFSEFEENILHYSCNENVDYECGTMLQDLSQKLLLQHVITFSDYSKTNDNVPCTEAIEKYKIITVLLTVKNEDKHFKWGHHWSFKNYMYNKTKEALGILWVILKIKIMEMT